MTKQELLAQLATECVTWKAAYYLARAEAFSQSQKNPGGYHPIAITYNEWLAERDRLLNKPSWDDAPEGATHLAMDGEIHEVTNHPPRWYFYTSEPTMGDYVWLPLHGCMTVGVEHRYIPIAVPAGYDWRESLEERPV